MHYCCFVNVESASVVSGVPSFTGSAISVVYAALYRFTPGLGSLSAANYDFTTFVNGTLTIAKTHLTVTAENQSKTYDGSAFTGFTMHYSGLVNGETANVVNGVPSVSGPAIGAVNAAGY